MGCVVLPQKTVDSIQYIYYRKTSINLKFYLTKSRIGGLLILYKNKSCTNCFTTGMVDEARRLAELSYDHSFNPAAWHLGIPTDSAAQHYFRATGNYDRQNEYPGPDGVLRRHNALTREAPDIAKLKVLANENRSFASLFDGSPDPARAEGVRRLLSQIAPDDRSFQDPKAPANDNEGPEPTQVAESCSQEWAKAINICIDLPWDSPLRGGHRDPRACAKGFVSERCGGNAVNWK